MSFKNRNDHPDANAKSIVKALRAAGYQVWYSGAPADLTVCVGDTLCMIEVKNPDRSTELQPDQEQLQALSPWNFDFVFDEAQALAFCERVASMTRQEDTDAEEE